jgi:hypothetical protein
MKSPGSRVAETPESQTLPHSDLVNAVGSGSFGKVACALLIAAYDFEFVIFDHVHIA